MLGPMDISQAGPWIPPWVLLVVVMALVLTAVGALLLLRRRKGRRRLPAGGDDGPAGPLPYRDDDLAAFLESPPGTAGSPAPPPGGWPALAGGPGAAPSPAPDVAPEPFTGRGRNRALVLGALALIALLIVATVLALAQRPPGPDRDRIRQTVDLPAVPAAPTPGQPGAGELADASVRPGREGGAARLEFGGLVLEQRAVGITATYPVVEATWSGQQGVAHVRLPTFNCLTATAPEDPVAAGCVPTVREYGDLPSPALTITGNDGTVQLSGRFPTYVRPNGTPPGWTGRVYELRVRAAPVDGEPAEGWVRAEGEIRLGSGRAATLDSADVTVLRRG